jgi:integrase
MARRFQKLTRAAMRELSSGSSIAEAGIIFRRASNGDGVFSVNIMIDRRRVHRVIGRESEGVTRQQTEDFVARARTDARRDRLDLPAARKTQLGFREATALYIERLRQEAGRNIKAKDRQLRMWLVPFFGHLGLRAISSFDIERYKKARRDASAAAATVNRELAVLSHLFAKATEWGWLKTSAPKIRRFKEENTRIIYLSQNQCEALLEAASHDQNDNVHAFIMVGLHTSMRHSEILSIRREHVDADRLVVWIPRAKAGPREQPITAELALYLIQRQQMLPAGCEWIFPSPGSRTGHVHTIRKAFRRSVDRAGLDPDEITPHTLRHTAVTHLVQAGVDLPTVQRISGHKTLAMVARYAHQNGAHIQTAMMKLQERMDDARPNAERGERRQLGLNS